ncbi:MAG: C45 family autoproteolytic acyltransferase/hydrolase [Verrucomicrobiae bacterium]|nr:C45 family autoproteolytic acyltransferase/hydrolase [Verrucomicrobiae bacterium]
MKSRWLGLALAFVFTCSGWLPLRAQTTPAVSNSPAILLGNALAKVAALLEPSPNTPAETWSAQIKLVRAQGIPKELAEAKLNLAIQSPNRARVEVQANGHTYALGRQGQELWIYAGAKQFGIVGQPGLPRFSTAPEKIDRTQLGRLKLPVPPEQLALLPLLFSYEILPEKVIDGEACHVFQARPLPQAMQALGLPAGTLTLALRRKDALPARIGWSDGRKLDVLVELGNLQAEPAWPAERWNIPARAGDTVEKVALGHVTRFLEVALKSLNQKIPTLPETVTGQHRLVATEGEGRLETVDGTLVLFVKGTPEEMGRQHGVLLRKQVRSLVDQILYGVGVGSSFEKGRWFFGEIEQAQARLKVDERYLREMDALAQAAGLEREEVRLANFFPELFHCSGFALFGKATQGGRMYHGRILDYLKGVGLEQNAVVMVMQPADAYAWVNVGYAGFVGTVTAMNEKQVAIGEMGGRGEGLWDGKPMAQLMREVMERAATLDEAVSIMRRGPRTCEYYYVISDAKSRKAVGIAATPDTFETIWPGQSHPRLPHAFADVVLMSAGDRYETLAARVRENYGKFDATSARALMNRPVCMGSNIQSVLFEPDTLDFWVANADSQNVASHTRYTRYNLKRLLEAPPAGK